jgi:hypothetical protein
VAEFHFEHSELLLQHDDILKPKSIGNFALKSFSGHNKIPTANGSVMLPLAQPDPVLLLAGTA